MKSLLLFLQAVLVLPLVAPLVEFATSTSGHIEPREGLALGWLGSVVAGLAVVFGTAEQTQADSCYGISEGSSGYDTTPYPCAWENHKPSAYWRDYYFHHSGTPGCIYQYSVCV